MEGRMEGGSECVVVVGSFEGDVIGSYLIIQRGIENNKIERKWEKEE